MKKFNIYGMWRYKDYPGVAMGAGWPLWFYCQPNVHPEFIWISFN